MTQIGGQVARVGPRTMPLKGPRTMPIKGPRVGMIDGDRDATLPSACAAFHGRPTHDEVAARVRIQGSALVHHAAENSLSREFVRAAR